MTDRYDHFHDDIDRPTRAEAEADARDYEMTPYEAALHMNAFASRGENGQPAVDYGEYPFSGFLVNTKRVADAIAVLLNEADPSTIHTLVPVLLQTYHRKMVRLEATQVEAPEEDDYEPASDWDDDRDSYYDPF